jgi:hypothetical protein
MFNFWTLVYISTYIVHKDNSRIRISSQNKKENMRSMLLYLVQLWMVAFCLGYQGAYVSCSVDDTYLIILQRTKMDLSTAVVIPGAECYKGNVKDLFTIVLPRLKRPALLAHETHFHAHYLSNPLFYIM